MATYTIDFRDGGPDTFAGIVFRGPLPQFGDEIVVEEHSLRFRVLRVEHRATKHATGDWVCGCVVIVEAA